MNRQHWAALIAIASSTLGVTANAAPSGHPVPTITESVDRTHLVELSGNTRPEATGENDRGAVDDSLDLGHMFLQLKRSPEREAALSKYIDELHDPKSSNFHQWLTPAQFAEHYGVDSHDVAAVTSWLKAEGFTVHGVLPTGLIVDFSGTAAQIRESFHTEIHNYVVDGVAHIANSKNPQIPSALGPAVAGVISLHNFLPKPMMVKRLPHPEYTIGSGTSAYHAIVAQDIETIYNLNPLLQSGISGQGQTIVVPEDTYLYSVTDWTVFRKTFGLARAYPKGTLTQEAPSGSLTCTNPGYAANGDDGEAAIDVEWASAAAPSAAIILAACKDGATVATFGGLIAIENILNSSSLPNVISLSYGESEAQSGAAGNLAFYNAYKQGAAEGVSIFVSSGDELASSAAGGSVSKYGVGISGWTSTPYNISVGGTDFGYTAYSEPATDYWNTSNTNTYASALSYIREIPWNGSCASGALSTYIQTNSYFGFIGPIPGSTPVTLCNNTTVTTSGTSANTYLFDAFGGSGGPSGCATGTVSTSKVVSGSCAGYAKPTWQSGIVGNPADGVRDIPDVSLMASNGVWDAYYTVCWSNPSTSDTGNTGGFSCNGAPSAWAGFGGTSVSSPIMAGIQALVDQATGANWGNANTVYYALANSEYGASGSSSCNSTTVNKTGNGCVFYDVTQGDIEGACTTTSTRSTTAYNCYIPSGSKYGILAVGANSTTTTATSPIAYPTSTGWDFSTGIGSVNAYNLVQAFEGYAASKGKK